MKIFAKIESITFDYRSKYYDIDELVNANQNKTDNDLDKIVENYILSKCGYNSHVNESFMVYTILK